MCTLFHLVHYFVLCYLITAAWTQAGGSQIHTNNTIALDIMDTLHTSGIAAIELLQRVFKDQSALMLHLSHLGDPRNAFLIYFPLSFCLHKPTGEKVLWLACLSEWINAILKWILFGQRPYWWVHETDLYQDVTPSLQQYRLTCETGPGSPSGHAMVTASVLLCMVVSFNKINKSSFMTHSLVLFLGELISWSIFIGMMLAVCVSRCYIATHFPHQVIFGAVVGILLTVSFNWIETDKFGLKQYLIVSIGIISTSVITYFFVDALGLDPQWSFSLADRWCLKSEWVHLDTSVFNAVFRDAGSILGYGIYHYLCVSKNSGHYSEKTSLFIKLLHVIMSLILCQFLENVQPKQTSVLIFYCITFSKFCILSIAVTLVTKLFLNYDTREKETEKQH